MEDIYFSPLKALTLDAYFVTAWLEPRLVPDASCFPANESEIEPLPVDTQYFKHLWQPPVEIKVQYKTVSTSSV